MRIIKFLVMMTFLIMTNSVWAEKQEPMGAPTGGGIVIGSEFGIAVSAPTGWIFDSTSGISQGLQKVMYPEGSTWADSRQMMYVNTGIMEPGETLQKFIQADIETFIKNSPDIKVEKMKNLTIQGGIKAEVREFTGEKWGNFERIAYVQKGSGVAMYVLSSKTRNDYEKSIDAFEKMVTNSFLMNMKLEK